MKSQVGTIHLVLMSFSGDRLLQLCGAWSEFLLHPKGKPTSARMLLYGLAAFQRGAECNGTLMSLR